MRAPGQLSLSVEDHDVELDVGSHQNRGSNIPGPLCDSVAEFDSLRAGEIESFGRGVGARMRCARSSGPAHSRAMSANAPSSTRPRAE